MIFKVFLKSISPLWGWVTPGRDIQLHSIIHEDETGKARVRTSWYQRRWWCWCWCWGCWGGCWGGRGWWWAIIPDETQKLVFGTVDNRQKMGKSLSLTFEMDLAHEMSGGRVSLTNLITPRVFIPSKSWDASDKVFTNTNIDFGWLLESFWPWTCALPSQNITFWGSFSHKEITNFKKLWESESLYVQNTKDKY